MYEKKIFLLLILVALGIISCKTDDSDSENVLQKFLLIFDSENVLQKFSVTFDSDGGSKVKGQVIESGKTATKPENPTKDGYDFEVWVLGDSPFDFSTPIISDITLKAKWTKHSSTTLPEEQKQFFTVTFDTNGGSGIVSQKIENGKTVTKPENPAKDGYDFEGWILGDSPFDFSTPITSDITLIAKWTKHTSTTLPEEQKQFFTVTFDTNGGSGIVSQKIENGKTVTKPENPAKDGYDFEGWILGDSPFDFSTPITSDITLIAKWTKHTSTTLPEEQKQFFTVTFDTNGGSGIVSQKIENGKTVTKPEDPYRERYSFIGWFLGDNKFDFSTPITSDITLKAKWDGQVFIVSFDSDGGTEITDQYIYKYGFAQKPTNPKKDSCIFAGWFLNDIKFDFTSTQINADITLKAKWTQIFTVTFDSDGGTNMTDWTVLDGETISKPTTPSKENYTFIGWFNGESEFDFSTPITSNLTLKAKWEKKVTVTFDFNDGRTNIERMIDKGSFVTSLNASWTKHAFKGWYNGDTLFDFSTPITSDITLTAKWVKLFTVKFDYDDAEHNVETKEVEEGQLITDVPNKSKQYYYELAKWVIDNTEFDFENTVITSDITLKAKYYRDSITSTLTMKHGWGDRNFDNLPIVEAVIISRKGKILDSGLVIRQELTYPRKDKNTHDHDVELWRGAFGTVFLDGHTYAFDLFRKTHYDGLVSTGDDLRVSRCAYSPYETKYSIVEVKRDSHKKNRYGNWVDVISIYIDVDF